MASKVVYSVVAVLGIAAASGVAWWVQHRPASGASGSPAAAPLAADTGAAPKPAGAGGDAKGPVAVEAARVEVTRLMDDAQTVGSLRSRQSVMVRPEVSGRVTQLNFRDGDRIRKGQVLVQLDDQLPQAQVQQSQAELSIAQANHKRNQDLVAQSFISQRSVDESAANLQVAQAKLALSQATASRLKIVAPFDGIAGIRTINVGDYVRDGTDIVNLEDMDAIYVDFRLPERYQTKVKRGQRAMLDVDALPGRKFTAVVLAIDPLLDANGRSIGLRGCVDNRALTLRPGMFARVNAVFGEREDARVVPEEALVPQGNRQFVIKLVDGPTPETRTTQRVEVKVGIRRPGRVEIVDGLNEGDQIVTAGQQRVQKDGTVVRVMDLTRGAGNANAQRSAASAPVASSAGATGSAGAAAGNVAPAQQPAPSATVASAKPAATAAKAPAGPNPCLVGLADARDAQKGGDKGGVARGAPKPDAPRPAMRNPA